MRSAASAGRRRICRAGSTGVGQVSPAGEPMNRSASRRHLRVIHLGHAMTRPAGVERERLDHALHVALDPILRSLADEVARMKAVMQGLIRPDPPVRLNDGAALPAFETDANAVARLRPGRRMSVIGLGVDPAEVFEAPTDALDAFARLTLQRHVPCLERTVGDLELLAVDYLADQEQRLEGFLESLPSPLLAELERVEATWASRAPEGEAQDERLDRLRSQPSATTPVEPTALVAEVRRLLGILTELSSSNTESTGESATARAARLIEPLLQLVLERDEQPAQPRAGSE